MVLEKAHGCVRFAQHGPCRLSRIEVDYSDNQQRWQIPGGAFLGKSSVSARVPWGCAIFFRLFMQSEVGLVMTELTAEDLFDQALERYKSGESPASLIPIFKDLCERVPKSSPAWTCLSWVYLLDNKPSQAYKAAQKAVKLNPQDPQSRINLAIAMLETAKSGVREHIDIASQLIMAVPELHQEVQQNIEDGLARKPDWKSLTRIKQWLMAES